MLQVPIPGSTEAEGKSDDTPMVLHPSIEAREFDALMEYLFKARTMGMPTMQDLTAILKLSTMWGIEDGRLYAIDVLPKHPQFTPAMQFYLGRTYHVAEWVEPAFRKLLAMPFSEIDEEIAHLMGPEAFYLLSHTHNRIKDHHAILAFYPSEPFSSFICTRAGRCEQAWVSHWWHGVAKHLLHPDSGKSGREILEMLDRVQVPGMCSHCQEANVQWVKDTRVMIKADEFVEDAVAKVVMWYGSAKDQKEKVGGGDVEPSVAA
ncbi:hypothetical protein GLOTRDRAFT_132837 [Gloeophyllum trabeum ATCC 11539]|nr:uncharacterized protein GLOTRDRAFT_132837 [Gloeophyllum trabeum ATCC 11539]EPQ51469.1 hypothetical protein GLOTRDRAFT_132837 [Gloeophyllum trabeum ATCC 11539]